MPLEETLKRMSASQKWDALANLWPTLDTEGQSVLLRCAWAMVSLAGDVETVKALGVVIGLVEPNESPGDNIFTC